MAEIATQGNAGTQANGAVQPGAPAAPAPWYNDFSDPDLKGFTELKGWKHPSEAVKSYRELESLRGVPADQLLKLPKADAKPEEWNPVYDRLGRPAKPEDYKLPTVEGGEGFAQKMAPLLHSAGLNQSQVDTIAKGWNAHIEASVKEMEAAQAQREQVDLQNLHREWPGEVFDQRQEMARRAVREFVGPVAGDSEKTAEMLGKIEEAVGTASFLKLFAAIGEKVGESKYIGDNARPGNFGMTPQAARVRLSELRADKEWGAKYLKNPGGPEGQEFERLLHISSQL